MNISSWAKALLTFCVFTLFFGGWSYSNYQNYLVRVAEIDAKNKKIPKKTEMYGVVSEEESVAIPYFPLMPPVDSRGDGENTAKRLYHLILIAPDEELRELGTLTKSSKILFLFKSLGGPMAQMGLVEREKLPDRYHDGTSHIPGMYVDPEFVLNIESQDEIARGILMLVHEFEHYRQMRVADDRGKEHFMEHYRSPTQDECDLMWTYELGAYTKQCHVSNHWGGTGTPDWFCGVVDDEAAFRRALFTQQKRQLEVLPICRDSWMMHAGL